MNRYIQCLIGLVIIASGCTDVIDVKVPNGGACLVVDASIEWEKGTRGNEQMITLTHSTSFFDKNKVKPVLGAVVTITKVKDGSIYRFNDEGNGNYKTTSFDPELNETYLLEIRHNNESYKATEKMTAVTDIGRIVQSKDEDSDKNEDELVLYFSDPKIETNFYLAKFKDSGVRLPYIYSQKDEFSNGNEMSFEHERPDKEPDFKAGDKVEITFYGISEQYFNYVNVLTEQVVDGGPFGTTPAPAKGNCVNQTNSGNNALGYFRLNQTVKRTFIVR